MKCMNQILIAGMRIFLGFLFIVLLTCTTSLADWRKLLTPADVDKKAHNHQGSPTCWLAAASNILAGAGYGTGATVQARADNIYTQMVNNYGTNNSGWTDTAVGWWLTSNNNNQKGVNPYTIVTLHGNKQGKAWLNQSADGSIAGSDDGAQFLGNELRRCQYVAVSIHSSAGGHAITAWGDSNDANMLNANPDKLIVSDSDKETGGDLQTYTYTFNSGWYILYKYNDFRWIKHIVTLCAVDANDANDPNSATTEKIVSSYKAFNSSRTFMGANATDLHYTVCSNAHILAYNTKIDYGPSGPLYITEDPCTPRKSITVDVNFTTTLPYNNAVTATTELVLPYDSNSATNVSNTSMRFTYPPPDFTHPVFGWRLQGTELALGADTNDPNISGGYVITSFDFFNSPGPAEPNKIAQYRFCCEYEFFQDPENHELLLDALEIYEPTWVGNFRFGHSYGLLNSDLLWSFEDWDIDEQGSVVPFEVGVPIVKVISLPGLLPYPAGENYVEAQLTDCEKSNIDGLGRTDLLDYALLTANWQLTGSSLAGDIDANGIVNYYDLDMFVDYWLDDCN